MDKEIGHPAVSIFDLYNEFRLCGGYNRDNFPAENVWMVDAPHGQKPQYIDDCENEADWTDIISPPIELVLRFDRCATDEEITEQIKRLRKEALNHPARHWASLLWAKNNAGRPFPVVATKLKEIDRCLKTYRDYQETGNKAAVSRKQGRFKSEYDTRQRQHSTERITPYLERAKRLVDASGDGFQSFITEAMKAVIK